MRKTNWGQVRSAMKTSQELIKQQIRPKKKDPALLDKAIEAAKASAKVLEETK